jgi:hypothetical protein
MAKIANPNMKPKMAPKSEASGKSACGKVNQIIYNWEVYNRLQDYDDDIRNDAIELLQYPDRLIRYAQEVHANTQTFLSTPPMCDDDYGD